MSELSIEFDWLDLEGGTETDRAFAATIGVAVGGRYVTRLDDLGARTVRDKMRGSAWHLAAWFISNWWRLRWEPAPHGWAGDTDWRLAHSMAAAGGGYVWPDAIFASDGEGVEIISRIAAEAPRFESIRYLNKFTARVTAEEFERKVDQFIGGVLSRLESFPPGDRSIAESWKEVQGERRHLKTRKRRKLEALAGYEPDEAPDELLKQLIQDKERLGKEALEEVAAKARHQTGELLEFLGEASRSTKGPDGLGFRGVLPERGFAGADLPEQAPPWQRARHLARLAREHWGFGKKPVLNRELAALVGTTPAIFQKGIQGKAPMAFALRCGTKGHHDIYFESGVTTSRRFAVSRLIGDHLNGSREERLLPATEARTSRQQFQRAFAQEFLCPLEALMETMQTVTPQARDIEAAADHFHVSPLMVRTTLVNNHMLERDALDWED